MNTRCLIVSVITVVAVSLYASQVELEAQFLLVPKETVRNLSSAKGTIDLSSVLNASRTGTFRLAHAPLKTLVRTGVNPSAKAMTHCVVPVSYMLWPLSAESVSNATLNGGPVGMLLPASTELREYGARMHVREPNVDPSGVLRCVLDLELSLPVTASYDAMCVNADSSYTRIPLNVTVLTRMAFESTPITLARGASLVLGSQDADPFNSVVVVLTSRTPK